MASNPDFVTYICEQLQGVGAIRSRKMFGEYMVYCNDKPTFLICDDRVLVKMLPCLEQQLADYPVAPPYDGAKDHYVLDPDDRETLRQVAAAVEEVTPVPKKKTKAKKSKASAAQEGQGGPIPWDVAWPKHMQPETADLASWVDNPQWEALYAWMEETYQNTPSVEYSSCSMAPGWNVKYKKGSKSLCVLYPQVGYFTAMVTVGAKLLPDVEVMLPTYSPQLQALYTRTELFMGGKWLMIEVREPSDLDDVQRLILMKAKPPKKKV